MMLDKVGLVWSEWYCGGDVIDMFANMLRLVGYVRRCLMTSFGLLFVPGFQFIISKYETGSFFVCSSETGFRYTRFSL